MNIQGAAYLHYNFQTFLKIEIDTFAGRHIPGTFVYISKIIHNWIIKKFPYLNLPSNPGNYQKISILKLLIPYILMKTIYIVLKHHILIKQLLIGYGLPRLSFIKKTMRCS